MPLYEYTCNACGHRFERIVKFSDPPLKICPHCGKDAVEQMIHAPAVQFKGSGWYVSDYARKSKSGAASPEAGDSVSASKEGGANEGAKPESGASTGKASGGAADKSSGGASKPGAGSDKK